MYRINEDEFKEKYILMVPAMLDAHFPLLKYALFSKNYHPQFLDCEEGITDIGLKHVHNDMCYPSVLNIGQFISALRSCPYDLSRVKLLMPSAGDACRGSNYVSALKKAVEIEGMDDKVKVLTLNAVGIDPDNQLVFSLPMLVKALYALLYGDILMLLVNQVRPYEKNKGEADKLWQKWIDRISEYLKKDRFVKLLSIKSNFEKMCADFEAIEKTGEKKERIGLVGELYIKYCHLGNRNVVKFIEEQGFETHTNGFTWYMLYYMDSHLLNEYKGIARPFIRLGFNILNSMQKTMIKTMRKHGFYSLDAFSDFKKEVNRYVNQGYIIADGWLIGGEITAHILHDCKKVLAMQPFGCMPNHTCGRGMYPHLSRLFPEGRIVSVDFDSSSSEVTIFNRVKMLLDFNV